jgi:hypothetical protein
MGRTGMGMTVLVAVLALQQESRAGDAPTPAPWDYAPAASATQVCCDPCSAPKPVPPMFGDQFQFGFNFGGGFQAGGGFNLGGQFGGGAQFGGGLQFGQFGGGLQLGGQFGGQFGQFGGQFGQLGGGFNLGGAQFGAPVAVARGAFKIGENGVARPQDRVFATYNYYNNVLGALDVHREMGGIEKTFAGGDASIEVRLPFVQNHVQNDGGQEDDIADLTFILKYALVNRADSVLSVGLATTAPTGPVPSMLILRPDGFERVHPWQLQPFVGYYQAFGDWYVQGFSSAMIPTDERDAVWLFNDVGLGYRLFEGGGLIRAVIPTVEAHVNTPLSNRGDIGFSDSVNVTAGTYFLLGERLTLGTAAGTPVTGPRLFDFEAIFSLNWRF